MLKIQVSITVGKQLLCTPAPVAPLYVVDLCQVILTLNFKWKRSQSRSAKQTRLACASWRFNVKYREIPMDLADACVVRLSELFVDRLVWTVDSDFKFYRRNKRASIPLMAPWQPSTI